MAKSLLRKVNGSNALLVKFASNTAQIKDALAQNTAELAALRAQSDGLTAGLRQQIVQLEKRLEQVSGEQAKTHAKLERVLHRQNQTIKPSHDIRLHLAFQEIKANGFWFVDIPRTSSTSLRVELGQQYGPSYAKANVIEKNYGNDQFVGDHVTAAKMARLMGAKAFGALFTFSVVRNPWARAYSFYSYRMRTGSLPPEWSFTEYCHRFTDLEFSAKFFNEPPYNTKIVKHLSSTMTDHLCDEDGKLLVKRIVKFEDRHAGLAAVAEEIGCPSLGAIHVQRTATPDHDYRTHYTPQTQKLIGDYYTKDVALLGYEF